MLAWGFRRRSENMEISKEGAMRQNAKYAYEFASNLCPSPKMCIFKGASKKPGKKQQLKAWTSYTEISVVVTGGTEIVFWILQIKRGLINTLCFPAKTKRVMPREYSLRLRTRDLLSMMCNQNRLTLKVCRLKLLQEKGDQPFTQPPARSESNTFLSLQHIIHTFIIQLKDY